jgi:hypothetical protein
MLQARLDAAYQCLDLGAAQAIVDVNPGDNPYLSRADEDGEELANGRHTGVPEEKGSYLRHLCWPQWLGEASNIAALRPPCPRAGPRTARTGTGSSHDRGCRPRADNLASLGDVGAGMREYLILRSGSSEDTSVSR